ncbi:Uncharacterized conserved protein [Blastococcus aggregatus]|uniref:Uncharacterized conserved protein n=1 Tax=Blastococcus aggregatus TaxID=38502 RepID=A0A285V8W0_9ACTN|nr:YciI family protein [Blastococcus aggregatus]SOC50509.1 Uncharacterized conserved protein [Blastococcus aggregatus]
MPRYLLTVVEPSTGPGLAPGALEKIMSDVDAVHHEMRDSGVWVFGGGLHPPSTATTLRPGDGGVLVTDGPFIEGTEHVGGFSVIDAPDLDAALAWGRKLVGATTIPIEVRPFYDGAG